MSIPVQQLEAASQIETEHRAARARLEAANARLSRAVAENERLTSLASVPADGARPLAAALEAAEASYRASLKALKTDGSDAARWRCARALIEFERISELIAARRVR